jgi:hypothetical protein
MELKFDIFRGHDYNESWDLSVKYAESEGFGSGEPNYA